MSRPPEPPERPDRRQECETLYRLHSREVWAVAYGRWLDADLAMDVVHETFLRYWRHTDAGGGHDSDGEGAIQNPRAWLLRVARNLAEDHAKSSFRKNGTQAPEHLSGIRSGETGPLELLEKAEARGQIRTALEELPPADREILTLRYAWDYDAPAIAEALGIQVSAVHMRLSRARQRLSDRLTAMGVTRLP